MQTYAQVYPACFHGNFLDLGGQGKAPGFTVLQKGGHFHHFGCASIREQQRWIDRIASIISREDGPDFSQYDSGTLLKLYENERLAALELSSKVSELDRLLLESLGQYKEVCQDRESIRLALFAAQDHLAAVEGREDQRYGGNADQEEATGRENVETVNVFADRLSREPETADLKSQIIRLKAENDRLHARLEESNTGSVASPQTSRSCRVVQEKDSPWTFGRSIFESIEAFSGFDLDGDGAIGRPTDQKSEDRRQNRICLGCAEPKAANAQIEAVIQGMKMERDNCPRCVQLKEENAKMAAVIKGTKLEIGACPGCVQLKEGKAKMEGVMRSLMQERDEDKAEIDSLRRTTQKHADMQAQVRDLAHKLMLANKEIAVLQDSEKRLGANLHEQRAKVPDLPSPMSTSVSLSGRSSTLSLPRPDLDEPTYPSFTTSPHVASWAKKQMLRISRNDSSVSPPPKSDEDDRTLPSFTGSPHVANSWAKRQLRIITTENSSNMAKTQAEAMTTPPATPSDANTRTANRSRRTTERKRPVSLPHPIVSQYSGIVMQRARQALSEVD